MRVMLAGYVLAEGRMSMAGFARTLHARLAGCANAGDRFDLDEAPGGEVATPLTRQGLSAKLAKRVGVPWRLRRAQCDVLHIVDSDYAAAIPAAKLDRTVVTCHDLMPFLQRAYGPGEPFGRMGRFFFHENLRKMARCACVVADSEFTRDCLLKYTACAPDAIRVIYLAIDETVYRPIAAEDPALRAFRDRYDLEGKTVVLHVGAGAWYKNVETVLEVFHRLAKDAARDWVLLKIGRLTPEQDDLARRLGIDGRIRMLPKLDAAEVAFAYNASHLLLWPSLFEGFGLCVLEAMACGIPVVCSDGGSLPEVAGSAALIHDPRDVDGLAESCQRIVGDPACREALRAAGFEQSKRFSWDRTAAEYLAEYRALV